MLSIPSAAVASQLSQWLSYELDFWSIAVRIPAATRHLFLLWGIQNSSEVPLNFLLDTGSKVVGAYSWPLTPVQNQVNNGLSTTPLPHTPSWCPQGLWYWTPRYQGWNFLPSFIVQSSQTLANESNKLFTLRIPDRQCFYKTFSHWIRELGGPQSGSGRFKEEKTICSSRESNPGQPKHKTY